MGVPVQAKTIKAADPGIGFTLEFTSPLNDTLRVVITLTDLQLQQPYTSEVILTNPIADQELVFVVPFGDSRYAPSNKLKYQIDLYAPYTAGASYQSLTGVVLGESGTFDFYTTVPDSIQDHVLRTGDMLQSADGTYVGVYQQDGNFCVYPQFANGQDTLTPVFTSNSDIDQPTYISVGHLSNGMYIVAIYSSSDNDNAISQTLPMPLANISDWTINDAGQLCLNQFPLVFQRV